VDFGTVITAMVTPFNGNLEVDYRKAGELAKLLVDNGSDGVLVGGTTGESPTLDDREKLKLFETVLEAVGSRAKVIAGTGNNSTAASIRLTKQAEAIGIPAVMLVCPYYNKPPQEGLYRHFEAIAKATDLPIMLYNVPGRTSVNMQAATTLRLAQLPNIAAVKEASGNLDQITEICAGAPEGFRVLSGDDSLTLPILAVGGSGIVSVASHLVGKEIAAMCRHYRQGDVSSAAALHQRLLPLFKVLFITTNPIMVKAALRLAGFDPGRCRLPLAEPSAKELAALKDIMQELDIVA
jgi:4-hydroxy-tetrahydrodipicolinate synthase